MTVLTEGHGCRVLAQDANLPPRPCRPEPYLRVTALGSASTETKPNAGESFLIEGTDTDDCGCCLRRFRAVVDVGEAAGGLGAAVAWPAPDVVVLTHSDSDHIGGFDEFADSLGPASAEPEFWLPSDWMILVDAAHDALRAPSPGSAPDSRAADQLLAANAETAAPAGWSPEDPPGQDEHHEPENATGEAPPRPALLSLWPGGGDPTEDDAADDPDERTVLKVAVDDVADRVAAMLGHRRLKGWDGTARKGLVAQIAKTIEKDRTAAAAGGLPDGTAPPDNRFPTSGVPGARTPLLGSPDEVAESVVKHAAAIAHVVARASGLGRLRWFSVDHARARPWPWPWRTEGLPGTLTVVNARQVRTWPRLPASSDTASTLVLAYSLTVVNRRALVVYAWSGPLNGTQPVRYIGGDITPTGLGALFWSDSTSPVRRHGPYAGFIPWEHTGLMTAPHHGSKDGAHEHVWQDRPAGCRVLLSNNTHDVTEQYFQIPPSDRGCDRCYFHSRHVPPQDAAATSAADGTWRVENPCDRTEHCRRP